MADDYIVIPSMADDKTTSNPEKEVEKADSAARDDGKNSATETEVGAADLGPHDDGKHPAKTAKRINGSAADSGMRRGGNNSATTTKKQEDVSAAAIIATLLFLLVFLLPLMVAIGAAIISDMKEKAEGPEFNVHSVSVSTFSISWWSETITADWNVSLGVKNLNSHKKFSYDFMQVSVLHGVTHLSTTMLHPFGQVAGDELLLNVNFPLLPAKIDASVADSIKETKRLNNSVSVNVVIRAKVSQDVDKSTHDTKWSKNLIASCKNIELQFSSNGEKAEMIAEEPVKCEFRSED